MTTLNRSAGLKLDNILVATDLSAASKAALLYAIPIARRHEAKLSIVHVSSSESPANVLDAWRAAQTELMDYFMAGHLKGVRHELLVKSGDVWPSSRVSSQTTELTWSWSAPADGQGL
jgi:nucleotide-binding universal stress UspA family protein